MSKKAKNNFIILIVLIVVFASGFLALNSVFASSAVFSLKSGEEINSIVLTNMFGTFSFTKELNGNGWIVETDGIRYRTHDTKMMLLLEVLSDIPVVRVLESENEIYGLSDPLARALIKTNRGRSFEYVFGNPGSNVNTIYAKTMAGTVFLTDLFVFNHVSGSLVAYRDKNVFSVDLLNIERLEYLYHGQSVVDCRRESSVEWFMDYPWTAPARHIELTELLARMGTWIIAGFPENVDLNSAGLSPPLETLQLTDKDGNSQTLYFGETEGIFRYVQTGEMGDIAFLYASDIDLSVLSPQSLVFIAPLRTRIDQVSQIGIEYGNETWNFTFDQNTNTAFWNYGILNKDEFVSVFFRFISVVADGHDAAVIPRLRGNPEVILSLSQTDGILSKLELFSSREDRFFMRINGEDTPYYIYANQLSNLLERIHVLEARKLISMSPKF